MAKKPIAYKRISVNNIRKDLAATFKPTSERITGVITQAAGADGTLNHLTQQQRVDLIDRVGDLTESIFVRPGTRKAFGQDGVTAVSPYATMLNRWYVNITYQAVKVHHDWMQKHVPDDVRKWLGRRGRKLQFESRRNGWRRGGLLAEADNPFLQQPGESLEDYQKRLEVLRLFSPNPNAQYEPMHTWVDPNGYVLSQRIWQTSGSTRARMERLLADLISQGVGALEIARQMEQFLMPGREALRTNRPYGSDASADAMRLARSEIARAANQAAYISAYLNPYVGGIDIARSATGDPQCPICPQYATIDIGGSRVRDPYPITSSPVPIFHPNCMCRVQAVVTDSPETVTARLRAVMQNAEAELLEPYMTPVQIRSFLDMLLGQVLTTLLAQTVQLPLI